MDRTGVHAPASERESMIASRRARALVLALIGGVFAGAAAAEKAAGAPACLLVAGAAGGAFADPRIDKFWLEVEREINSNLFAQFQRGGYAVESVFEEAADRGKTPMKSLVAIGRSGCAYMLQVTNDVNEDAAGRYFAFDVSLLRFVANDGGPPRPGVRAIARPGFKKRYRYPRTQEAMNAFDMRTFATTVFTDVQASGEVEFARTGVLPPLEAASTPAPTTVAGDQAPLDPKLLARAYDAYVAKWNESGVKELHVRHILLANEADARAAIARIQGGEDFGAVARATSADAASRDQGGDLGWNRLGAFAPDVAKAAKLLEPKGLATQPVHTAVGWEVVEVLDVRPAPPQPFDAIKDKLEAAIRVKLAARAASAAH